MSLAATNIFNVPVPSGDDLLALLPRTDQRQYNKSDVIYSPQHQPRSLYLVIEGRVKISRLSERGEVVLDFHGKDEFFGEAGCLGLEQEQHEQATALENAAVMQWAKTELQQLMVRTPQLGTALLRVLAQKLANANQRVESFCLDPISRRLVKALLDLSERLGQRSDRQLVHVGPITHEQLAQHVGTSRENVTQCMNQLRRQHLVEYSRRGIDVDAASLKRHLAEQRKARAAFPTPGHQGLSGPRLVV